MKHCSDEKSNMEPCVVTSCKCSCFYQLRKYLDGETFIHIEGCPTPKNETIDFIQYGGRQLPQHVNDGKRTFNQNQYNDNFFSQTLRGVS